MWHDHTRYEFFYFLLRVSEMRRVKKMKTNLT